MEHNFLFLLLFLFSGGNVELEEAKDDPLEEVYYSLYGEPVPGPLPKLGHFIYYFVIPEDKCFSPLSELLIYPRLVNSYPHTKFSVVFYDLSGEHQGNISQLADWIGEHYQFTGSVYLDREGAYLKKHNLAVHSRILVFNRRHQRVADLLPALGRAQKERFKLYFQLVREYL